MGGGDQGPRARAGQGRRAHVYVCFQYYRS